MHAEAGHFPALPQPDRVGSNTRAALLKRGALDDPGYRPAALTPAGLRALRAVTGRVLPGCGIDLAARIDTMLADGDGDGDGWRLDVLRPAAPAYRVALASLDYAAQAAFGQPFADLHSCDQDGLLVAAAAGRLDAAPLGASRMKLWFEDARTAAVRLHMSHTATMARTG